MNTIIKRALWGTLIAGGITLLGATTANAAETTGEDGLLSGTQALVGVVLPITITDTSISIVGDSTSEQPAATTAAAPPAAPAPAAVSTSGQDAVASGTQGVVSVAVPITVSGNAVSVIGDSTSSGAASTPAVAQPAAPAESTTSGDSGIGSGTQGIVSLDVPVALTGNAISVIGDSRAEGVATSSVPAAGSPAPSTSGDGSIAGGTQIVTPIAVPITIGGNAVSVVGDSTTTTPTIPTTPVTPVTPVTPIDPTDPVTPGSPTTPLTPAATGTGGSGFLTAAGAGTLAASGPSSVTAALLAGLALAIIGVGMRASRRTARG